MKKKRRWRSRLQPLNDRISPPVCSLYFHQAFLSPCLQLLTSSNNSFLLLIFLSCQNQYCGLCCGDDMPCHHSSLLILRFLFYASLGTSFCVDCSVCSALQLSVRHISSDTTFLLNPFSICRPFFKIMSPRV